MKITCENSGPYFRDLHLVNLAWVSTVDTFFERRLRCASWVRADLSHRDGVKVQILIQEV
jgi:hypothetical protein